MNITPASFARVELVSGGVGVMAYRSRVGPVLDLNLISLQAEWHRVRLGASLLHVFDLFSLGLPVTAGYTIWSRPRNYTGRLFSMNSEGYIQATGELFGSIDEMAPSGWDCSLEFRTAADAYGVGYFAAAGVEGRHENRFMNSPSRFYSLPFIKIGVRLGTLMAGF